MPSNSPESNYLVRASRAGDRFHYCWAARRSLLLLDQNSGLERIVIEGDDPTGTNGEYSLDMTEVYRDGFDFDVIKCQFKYSVERVSESFTFSELQDTIVGFAENYRDPANHGKRVHYLIVTNRGVSNELRSCVEVTAAGGKAKGRTANSFFQNIKLKHDMLTAFCATLEFRDMEGDLETQFQKLRAQSASYIAGIPTVQSIYALVDMVARKALPKSDGIITQEDVLSNFCSGISSISAFYPAPVKFDEQGDWIETAGYKDVRSRVLKARGNVFIHAPGGVGKTVTLRKLAADTPSGSVAILFDCYAAGEYSNRIRYRHTPEKACVQIANELASKGLCDPLVADNGMTSQTVFEAFYKRIECAVGVLRQKDTEARLYVCIDAADNARMMAAETKEPCCVDFILQTAADEVDGCTMIFSARTGRMNEFWPDLDCEKIELMPFTASEVGEVLRLKFRNAPLALSNKLFVRTSGLPRIVAGILADCKTVKDVEIASSFAPLKDYDSYLETKYKSTLKRYSRTELKKLGRLCRCLVALPSNVPIDVLGAAANVSKDFIVGFISDWERPLWCSQDYVHFRDEPTETWFKGKFGDCQRDLKEVIKLITPLSRQYVYVARSLPSLLLRAEAYEELEKLAESDEALPGNIHLAEQKELKLERMRFAISAMIRSRKYLAAMRLSLLAGDIVSESVRRDEILRGNLVFASKVLPKATVEELSATRQVALSWRGSENLCTGVLLSSLNDTRDEVSVHVESAMRWLLLHIEEENKKPSDEFGPRHDDYSYAASLFGRAVLIAKGPHAAVRHISGWRSANTRYCAASYLVHDCVSFDEKPFVEDMLCSTKDAFILMGLISGAMDYGVKIVIRGWKKIASSILALSDANRRYWDSAKDVRLSIARFAVWIARQKGGRSVAVKLLSKFVLPYGQFRIHNSPYDSDKDVLPFYVLARICQGKTCSIKALLKAVKVSWPAIPEHDLGNVQVRLEKLLPVYMAIIRTYLSGDERAMPSVLNAVSSLLDDYQLFHRDKTCLFMDSVSWLSCAFDKDMDCLHKFIEQNAHIGLASASELLMLSRLLYRRGHVKTGSVCHSRGADCFEACKKDPQEYPDSLASLYIQAAEACYSIDCEDARGYFSGALDVLSKCGDELLPRWSAVTQIARRLSRPDVRGNVSQEFVYNFTRCGEFVRSCVCRDKYYNRDEVFSILTDFDPAYAWATYSRWRDRDIGSFQGDLGWVLEIFVQKGVMPIEEAWSFREFGDCGEIQVLTEAIVRTNCSQEFKRQVFDELLMNCAKNGCSSRNFHTIKRLAEQIHVNVPEWLHPQPDGSYSSSIGTEHDKKEKSCALSTFDGNDPDWIYKVLSRSSGVWYSDYKYEMLFSKIPDQYACAFLRQLAVDERIRKWDVDEIIAHFPKSWQRKPGVRDLLPEILEKLIARYVKEGRGDSVGEILRCADEFGIGQNITEVFLNCMANIVSLGGEGYYQIVKNGIRVLTVKEMVEVLDCALKRVAEGMDGGFGDGEWRPSMWPDKSFKEVTKDLLWTTMGDPDIKIRWMATHCVVNELLRAPAEMVAGCIKRLACSDFTPCVAKNLPTYIYYSRMHFLLALAKVSKRVAAEIRKNAQELIMFLRGQEHVLIRYFGWKILVDAGVNAKALSGLNPIDSITIQNVAGGSWNFRGAVVHKSIKALIGKKGWFPMHYDFEKYWVPSLAHVFGLDTETCNALLKWAASSMVGNGPFLMGSHDPRRSQFYDDGSTRVSCSGMPEVSDYNFYISYHALLILAGRLLKYQSVIKCSDDVENRFSTWIKEFLPVYSPDLSTWQSDVRGNLPACVASGEGMKKIIEQEPLKDIEARKLLCLDGKDDEIIIDGKWRIGSCAKEFECSLNCALVSKKSATATRDSMCRMKDPMSLALPVLFDNPNEDCRNHGKFKWRGLYDSEHEYLRYHLDEKDPAAGGLHIVRFNVATTIRKDLKLREVGDHILLMRKGGSRALVSWYWGNASRGRYESSGDYGCTLQATSGFLNELCRMYNSELIIELILRRYKHVYRYNHAEREEEEECYRYVLYSPGNGLY